MDDERLIEKQKWVGENCLVQFGQFYAPGKVLAYKNTDGQHTYLVKPGYFHKDFGSSERCAFDVFNADPLWFNEDNIQFSLSAITQ